MGIKIVNQNNEQECGVCALTALHNHFYSETITKEQVLDKSNIVDNGMTIFDFESLGSKLGLECESYELKWIEFQNLKINNYFVLLLLTQNGSMNHYVIARKKKKYIEIYDSCSMGMHKISYSEIKKRFLNVIILIKKHPNKLFSSVFGKASNILMFDLKFVLLNLALSVLILACSICCASFLNFIIDLGIGKSSLNNIITICFIFVLFYFVNNIFSYVQNLYMSRQTKSYFMLFTNKILSCLQYKKLNFLHKVDKNWMFKVDECVYNISHFSIIEINKFITNIIFIIACICVIGSIQYYLLIFVVLYAFIEVIFFFFSYRKKREVFLDIIRSENNNAHLYKNLLNSLSQEMWAEKRRGLIEKIKSNYSNIYKNYSDVILFKGNTGLFKSLFKSLCEICLIATMGYLIIKTNKLSIGKLTFVISSFGLYKNSTEDLLNYFLAKLEFNTYWQVYKDLTSISNVDNAKNFILKQDIKSVSFKVDNQMIDLYINQTFNQIGQPIINLIRENNGVFINDKKAILNKQLFDLLIVFDQHTSIDSSMLIKNVEYDPKEYSQYLQYFKIDLNLEVQSFYHSLIINFLCLLHEKNKIIFIDDIFVYVKKKDRLVIRQIVNKIKKNNAVFLIGKEGND